MKFALAALVASVVAIVSAAPQLRQQCAEASRFGGFSLSPTTISAGDILTISADFTCAIYFGIIPKYTDYYIEVVENNNGFEAPILLARRSLPPGVTSDSFTVVFPDAYYFSGAGYSVQLKTIYPVNGTLGVPFYEVGGIGDGITINV